MAGFRMLTMQMDGVKTALGGTYTATDTTVLIHDGRTATEATCGLFANLLFGQGLMIVRKRILLRFYTRVLTAAVVITLDHDLGFVQLDEVSSVTTDSHMSVLHESMQTLCRFLSSLPTSQVKNITMIR